MDKDEIESVFVTSRFIYNCNKYSDKEYINQLEDLIEDIINGR